jgi:hypothetical protein
MNGCKKKVLRKEKREGGGGVLEGEFAIWKQNHQGARQRDTEGLLCIQTGCGGWIACVEFIKDEREKGDQGRERTLELFLGTFAGIFFRLPVIFVCFVICRNSEDLKKNLGDAAAFLVILLCFVDGSRSEHHPPSSFFFGISMPTRRDMGLVCACHLSTDCFKVMHESG